MTTHEQKIIQNLLLLIAAKEKKIAPKKESRKPTLTEVENYFASNKWTSLEAKKFFNHYQSNGWLVGKVPMKDWQAAAEKWLLNIEHFKITKANNLHATTDKNYNEPL